MNPDQMVETFKVPEDLPPEDRQKFLMALIAKITRESHNPDIIS